MFFFQWFLHPPKYMKGWIWLDIIVYFHRFLFMFYLSEIEATSSFTFLSFFLVWCLVGGGDHNSTTKFWVQVFL